VLAEDHPSRLASQHALAGAYWANGQVTEAVELLEQVVAIKQKAMSKEHPNRLLSEYALLQLYEKMQIQVVELLRRVNL
jgi:thioredoxin-like negative regulator of GroEL